MVNAELISEAEKIAIEIRKGKLEKWYHKYLPITLCMPAINELKRRCPNYKNSEYRKALAKGMFNTR